MPADDGRPGPGPRPRGEGFQAGQAGLEGEVRSFPRRFFGSRPDAAGEQGGGGGACQQVPARPGEVVHQGEQLDVHAADLAEHRLLRALQHLQRGLPHLRRERPPGHIPPQLPFRAAAQAVPALFHPRGAAAGRLRRRRCRAQLANDLSPGRADLPLYHLPPLRRHLPGGGGQRPDEPRTAENIQPGAGDRFRGRA